MAVLHQYDYIFVLTTIFAILDAWNIGANDVANSFATSVSSRSLTMKQAMLVAAVCEFSGSVTVGARVADTIRNKIVEPHHYSDSPAVLLLAMMCTIVGSSLFLTFATRNGMPVSTTHSVIGGLVGTATASIGIKKVNWGWDGVSQVFAAWIIAPGIAGCLGAFLFFVTKRYVLTRQTAVRHAFYSIPFYTFLKVSALTMLIAWKGVQASELSTWNLLVVIFGTASGITLLQAFFLLPFLWVRIIHEDWTLKWYHIFQGPLLLYRSAPPPTPAGFAKHRIKDYYRGHLTREELEYMRESETLLQSVQTLPGEMLDLDKDDVWILPPPAQSPPATPRPRSEARSSAEFIPPRPPGPWNSPRVLGWKVNRVMLRGIEKDVISMQKRNAVLNWDLEDMHARAAHYDNRAEYMYSALQILTAATASFTHGANDVSNAISPFTTAYEVWSSGEMTESVEIPVWILCMGGASIVLGLLTYGYHVMRTLGNRLTLISPSRGFCMELASALTVVMATKLRLPVSTTQCITGATVGVGLANGDWRCINPRLVAWIYLGWIITVPVTALLSGCLMGLILNAPRWEP
ncbi:Phosphate-repressible phosphate permease pho-4 [Neonectria ditissima]|uniref:Phosphate transporter n=1 Tax=Neonectria ditissima TaxID=78410 RepID=A0A0P7BPL3_9HYPO|nr:Phosphate-repressible phosphate permease pho-4 [Neonectria ditissima]